MSSSSLSAWSAWRDYWGMWNAFNEPQFAPIEDSGCHVVRLALAPDIQNQLIPDGGKIEFNFHLQPGSLIWGLWVVADVTIQLTDVSLQHEFFQGPVMSNLLRTQNIDRLYPSYFLFPTPHPVVGDGLFTLEIWGTVGVRAYAIFGVAEVTDCLVK